MTVGADAPAREAAVHGGVARERRALVDATLARLVPELLAGTPATVAEPARYALEAGGKRLRPVLCLAAYEAVGGRETAAAAELACALELIHTYSLVHDDLPCMDDDDLRRGRPTTHRGYGTRAAIAAGLALVPLAVAALLRGARALGLSGGTTTAVARELLAAAGAGGMIGGQWLDLAAEGCTVSLEELETIHRRKTGALLAAAPRIGGMAAGAPPEVVAALGRYGGHLGLAFQIADDILDVTGSEAVLGKGARRDQELGKATYPALLGVEGAGARARAGTAAAIQELRAADVIAPELEELARYAVERDR